MPASVASHNILDLRSVATPNHTESIVRAAPKKQKQFKKPSGRLFFHPVSLGLLGGLLAAFIIGVVLPSIPAKVVSPVAQAAPTLTPSQVPAPAAAPVKSTAPAKPTDHLTINRIGINAPVTSVDLTKEGAIDTPKTLWQVGHYDKSAVVGATGTAVIVGHSGAPGQVGVFENISHILAGDVLTYTRIDGTTVSFRVISSRAYPLNNDTAKLLVAPTAIASLNLISCYGNWDQKSYSYDQRWIVKSELIK